MTFSEDGCSVSGEAGTLHNSDHVCSLHVLTAISAARHYAALLPPAACKDVCASAAGSCETITFLFSAEPQPQPAPDNHHPLSLTTSQSDLGPLAPAETSGAKFVRILLLVFYYVILGVQKVLLGSVVVFWMLTVATAGCILTIGLWLQGMQNLLRERREREQALDAGLRARQIGRRVRWRDEVEGGLEPEEGMDGK